MASRACFNRSNGKVVCAGWLYCSAAAPDLDPSCPVSRLDERISDESYHPYGVSERRPGQAASAAVAKEGSVVGDQARERTTKQRKSGWKEVPGLVPVHVAKSGCIFFSCQPSPITTLPHLTTQCGRPCSAATPVSVSKAPLPILLCCIYCCCFLLPARPLLAKPPTVQPFPPRLLASPALPASCCCVSLSCKPVQCCPPCPPPFLPWPVVSPP
jgi:hypothetical protein